MIKIQLHESSNKQEIQITKDNPEANDILTIPLKRSWQRIINLLQTEDIHGYGTQFRPIPQFANYNDSSCFTWVLFSILNSCKELWVIIDSKDTPFEWSSWEGWILTVVQHFCFQNNSIVQVYSSLFLKTKSMTTIIENLNKNIPR